MATWSEDVALELEALQATYGDDLVVSEQTVSMLLKPVADSPVDAYVQCQLVLGIAGAGYPENSPSIQLQDVKGLTSSQVTALKDRLAHEAESMLGELVLGQLFESAKDWLTEHNQPEGACIFCLEVLNPAHGDSNTQQNTTMTTAGAELGPYVKLPCYHVFHLACFMSWWVWKQQSLLQQQKQLEQRTGATAAAALVQEELPPTEGDLFQLSCPSCRSTFSLQQDLQHLEQLLMKQLQQHQQQQQPMAASSEDSTLSSSTVVDGRLTAAQLAPFKQIQQQHAVLYAAQQRRDGIITAVSHSIADWDAAAATTARQSSSCIGDSSRIADQSHRGSRGGRGVKHRHDSHRQRQQQQTLQVLQDGRNLHQGGGHSRSKGSAEGPLQQMLKSRVMENGVQQQQQQQQRQHQQQQTGRPGSASAGSRNSGSDTSRRGRGRGRGMNASQNL